MQRSTRFTSTQPAKRQAGKQQTTKANTSSSKPKATPKQKMTKKPLATPSASPNKTATHHHHHPTRFEQFMTDGASIESFELRATKKQKRYRIILSLSLWLISTV